MKIEDRVCLPQYNVTVGSLSKQFYFLKILPESFIIVLPEFACVETGEGINLFVDVGRMTKKHGNINKYAVFFEASALLSKCVQYLLFRGSE